MNNYLWILLATVASIIGAVNVWLSEFTVIGWSIPAALSVAIAAAIAAFCLHTAMRKRY